MNLNQCKDSDVIPLIDMFWNNLNFQNINSKMYLLHKTTLENYFKNKFKNKKKLKNILNIKIDLPFYSFGKIDTSHLFGLDELLIFYFYIKNVNKYKRVADIGTNIGIHSKILCKLGFEVDSFEPDSDHFRIAQDYLKNCNNNNLYNVAISSFDGKAEFTKIINNTTGNFLNDKKIAHGPINKCDVEVKSAKSLVGKYDLIKIDAEGSEIDILLSLGFSEIMRIDIILEISTLKNRDLFWKYFCNNRIVVYSQKISWNRVKKLEDLPSSHKEGSVFISNKNKWNS